jgi:hypothetical protein
MLHLNEWHEQTYKGDAVLNEHCIKPCGGGLGLGVLTHAHAGTRPLLGSPSVSSRHFPPGVWVVQLLVMLMIAR